MAKICGIKSILGRWRVRYVRDYAVPEYHPQTGHEPFVSKVCTCLTADYANQMVKSRGYRCKSHLLWSLLEQSRIESDWTLMNSEPVSNTLVRIIVKRVFQWRQHIPYFR
ncbi:hypothetical protein QL093DRAFT_2405902 [Fusarium oxysporum]|nr:hypothetical protein QL093DRAFT_2405902 [Fusarium oxysporum]